MRQLVDVGSIPRSTATFKLMKGEIEPQGGQLLQRVHDLLLPLMPPLAKKRDEVTKSWPKIQSPFANIYEKQPGEVRKHDYLLASFQNSTDPMSAGPESTVEPVDAVLGKGVAVTGRGTRASAQLEFGKIETETWVAFAVRAGCRGEFAVWATDGAGVRYRWRTFVLEPGTWYKLAVPLGAFEPVTPTEGYETPLGKRVDAISFSLDSSVGGASESPARFELDELLLRCGQSDEPLDAAVAQ
jgi:hypothetical protein